MKRHLLLLATLALPALAAAGPATSFADAAKRHRSGDTAAAMAFWVPLAQQGDANAAFNLGTIDQYGDGVATNPAEALKWYASPPSAATAKRRMQEGDQGDKDRLEEKLGHDLGARGADHLAYPYFPRPA